MSQALIDELKRENLCTHFVLPLLKINKFSFIASNFVNAYLSPDGRMVIVEVAELMLLGNSTLKHPDFRGKRHSASGQNLYLLYQIPVKWRTDVQLFMQGKFSLMSKSAKDTIIRFSKLPRNEKDPHTGKTVTDGRLLALERHKVLKESWERELEPNSDASNWLEGAELLSIPGEESYIDPAALVLV